MSHQQQENISVRDAVPSDLDHLVAFNTALALETEGRTLDQSLLRSGVQAILKNPSRGYYLVGEVLQQHAQPAVGGQLLITYEWSDWRNANFWWIQSVYVSTNWRRRGIFRELYQYTYDQVHERTDVCGLRLYVEQDNNTALAVYAKMGLETSPYRMLERDFASPPKLVDSKDTP